MIFGKQDTHVPREGRDLIRKELEDAEVIASVRPRPDPRSVDDSDKERDSSWKCKRNTRLFETNRPKGGGMQPSHDPCSHS